MYIYIFFDFCILVEKQTNNEQKTIKELKYNIKAYKQFDFIKNYHILILHLSSIIKKNTLWLDMSKRKPNRSSNDTTTIPVQENEKIDPSQIIRRF